ISTSSAAFFAALQASGALATAAGIQRIGNLKFSTAIAIAAASVPGRMVRIDGHLLPRAPYPLAAL
ncbi:hypothetical protein, partial [Klebsiella pneumoniae]|uniref:hypothetical protein n=1 Tax=Klebsiella pneumoniae TaxID=573 RepID=UPI003CFCA4E4